jgi:prepilin-type N-terminal cleavage/methylation domain-containing protein
MKKRTDYNGGFTLIELVAVIAILAALLTLGMPTFKGLIGKADDEVCMQNMSTVKSEYAARASSEKDVVDFSSGDADTSDGIPMTTAMTLIQEVIEDNGGTNFTVGGSNVTYKDNEGNTITVTFAGTGGTDRSMVGNMVCSKHGTLK